MWRAMAFIPDVSEGTSDDEEYKLMAESNCSEYKSVDSARAGEGRASALGPGGIGWDGMGSGAAGEVILIDLLWCCPPFSALHLLLSIFFSKVY